MAAPSLPKKGPGQYGDDFKVTKIEGGYLLSIEHTTQEDFEVPAGVAVAPAMRAQIGRVSHVRSVVAKTPNEVIGHLREWTGANRPEGADTEG